MNVVIINDHNATMMVWNAYLVTCVLEKVEGHSTSPGCKHPKTGAIMKRALSAPKFQSVIIMYMWWNSHCVSLDNHIGSTCFIKCIDYKTGQ